MTFPHPRYNPPMRALGLFLAVACLTLGVGMAIAFKDAIVLLGGSTSFVGYVAATALGVFDRS